MQRIARNGYGTQFPKKLPFVARLIGAPLKPKFFGEKPFSRNAQTDKLYIIQGNPDFESEKAKAIRQVKAFSAGGPLQMHHRAQGFFWKLRPEEWAIMQWKHFDHHMRQFCA